MYALPESEGCADQHWHRDTGLPFEDDEHFHLRAVHARDGGALGVVGPSLLSEAPPTARTHAACCPHLHIGISLMLSF